MAATVSQRLLPLEVLPFSRAVKAHLASRLREEYERFRQIRDEHYVVDAKRHGTRFWERVLAGLMHLNVDPIDYICRVMDHYAHPPWPSGLLTAAAKQAYYQHHSKHKQEHLVREERNLIDLQIEYISFEMHSPAGPKKNLRMIVREKKHEFPAMFTWCLAVKERLWDIELEFRPKLVPFILNPRQRHLYRQTFPAEIAILRVMLSAETTIDGVPPFLSPDPLFPVTPSRNAMESGAAPTGEAGELQERRGVGA